VKISRHLHQQIRLKNWILTLLFLGLMTTLAWLSLQFSWQIDITGNAANSLSTVSQQTLKSIDEPIKITAYIKKGQAIRTQISQLVARYRQQKANITLNFIDPESQPEISRELNIPSSGIIHVAYQGRLEKITFLDETTLTNALIQLANAKERYISFLTGHGERSPAGSANFDLSQFDNDLKLRKINSQTINLATIPAIPDNTALLVISAPTAPLLPGELSIIQQYIQKGGNLLLLSEPNNQNLSLLELLGMQQLPGTIVETNSKLYGVDDVSFIVVSDYVQNTITQDFQTITLYPGVAALEVDAESDFQSELLFSSSQQSWTETGPLIGQINFNGDSNEKQGPLSFAYALTRSVDKRTQQRIVVIGDGDFLSNTYIGNVGNREMGLRIVNWLIHDDRSINIPAKNPTDKTLQLTKTGVAIMGFGYLLVLPGLLMGAGFFIWRKRKQQ
jgi:ABC-type uncharacterized transport system involved in gliding motility auxiliary subunit